MTALLKSLLTLSLTATLCIPSTWAQNAASAAPAASNCESIRSKIDASIAANGVKKYELKLVDANAPADGKMVGSCDKGSKKIMYIVSQGTAPATSATTPQKIAPVAGSPSLPPQVQAKPASKPIITECADGRTITSGNCSKKP